MNKSDMTFGEGLDNSGPLDNRQSSAPDKSLANSAPSSGWDTMGRRGVWIEDAREAEKLRTLTDTRPAVDTTRRRSASGDGFHPVMRALQKIGIGALAGGIVFLILIITLGHECFLALAYCDYVNAGLKALSEGQAALAQVEFGLSISADPRSSDSYYYRAISEVQLGSNTNALQDYNKALELNPGNLKAYLARAVLSMKAQHYDEAVQDCSAVIRLDPAYADAYRVRASAYNHLLQFPKAIEDATKFLSQHPAMDSQRADVLSKRAFALDRKHDRLGAVEDYTEAIACDSNNGALYASRAIVYMHLQQWQRSLDDCTLAIGLRPSDPVAYKVRGICNAQLKLSDDSLADLDKLVILHPTVDTHRIRGDQRFVAHDYLGTLEDFDYVLQAEPDDKRTNTKYQKAKIALQATAPRSSAIADAEPRAKMPVAADLKIPLADLVRKGYDLLVSGDSEPAIKYLTAAVKTNRNDASARRYLAYAFVQGGMPSQAISQFNALATIGPFLPGDKLLCADVLVVCKQPGKAIALYTDLLACDPKNDRARTNLIKTMLDNGSADEAAKLAAEGIQQSPALHDKYNELLQRAITSKSAKG